MENKTAYEYGAMSSRYRLYSKNKLTAYAAMCVHFKESAHLLVIYEPEELKKDSWISFTGKSMDKLNELFGDFEHYLKENIKEIKEVLETIEEIV